MPATFTDLPKDVIDLIVLRGHFTMKQIAALALVSRALRDMIMDNGAIDPDLLRLYLLQEYQIVLASDEQKIVVWQLLEFLGYPRPATALLLTPLFLYQSLNAYLLRLLAVQLANTPRYNALTANYQIEYAPGTRLLTTASEQNLIVQWKEAVERCCLRSLQYLELQHTTAPGLTMRYTPVIFFAAPPPIPLPLPPAHSGGVKIPTIFQIYRAGKDLAVGHIKCALEAQDAGLLVFLLGYIDPTFTGNALTGNSAATSPLFLQLVQQEIHTHFPGKEQQLAMLLIRIPALSFLALIQQGNFSDQELDYIAKAWQIIGSSFGNEGRKAISALYIVKTMFYAEYYRLLEKFLQQGIFVPTEIPPAILLDTLRNEMVAKRRSSVPASNTAVFSLLLRHMNVAVADIVATILNELNHVRSSRFANFWLELDTEDFSDIVALFRLHGLRFGLGVSQIDAAGHNSYHLLATVKGELFTHVSHHNSEEVWQRDDSGQLPLDLAIKVGNLRYACFLLTTVALPESFIRHKCNEAEATLLHRLASLEMKGRSVGEYQELLRHLGCSNAHLVEENQQKQNAIDLAFSTGNIGFLRAVYCKDRELFLLKNQQGYAYLLRLVAEDLLFPELLLDIQQGAWREQGYDNNYFVAVDTQNKLVKRESMTALPPPQLDLPRAPLPVAHAAICARNYHFIESMNPHDFLLTDAAGNTPLMFAVKEFVRQQQSKTAPQYGVVIKQDNLVALIKLCVTQVPEALLQQDAAGNLPLTFFYRYSPLMNGFDEIQEHIKISVAPDFRRLLCAARDVSGVTWVQARLSVFSCPFRMEKTMLDEVDFSYEDQAGKSTLAYVAYYQHAFLLKHIGGNDISALHDQKGCSPLHYAAENVDTKALIAFKELAIKHLRGKERLRKLREILLHEDADGNNVVLHAARNSFACLMLLLDIGVGLDENFVALSRNLFGQGVLHLAAVHLTLEEFRKVCIKAAETTPSQDFRGNNCLHFAVMRERWHLIDGLYNDPAFQVYLDQPNNAGETVRAMWMARVLHHGGARDGRVTLVDDALVLQSGSESEDEREDLAELEPMFQELSVIVESGSCSDLRNALLRHQAIARNISFCCDASGKTLWHKLAQRKSVEFFECFIDVVGRCNCGALDVADQSMFDYLNAARDDNAQTCLRMLKKRKIFSQVSYLRLPAPHAVTGDDENAAGRVHFAKTLARTSPLMMAATTSDDAETRDHKRTFDMITPLTQEDQRRLRLL